MTGIVTHLSGIREAARHGGPLRRISRFGWVAMPLYALVTIVAGVPDLARRLGLEPLQLEGYALVFIVLAGIILAWMLFTDPVLASGQVEEDAG